MKHMYSPLRTLLRALVLALTLFIGTSTLAANEKNLDKNIETEVVTIVQEAAQPTVQTHHGKLLINIPGQDNVTISVFALTGKLVKQLTVTPGQTQLDLPAGYYIIRIGEIVKRIALT